MGLKQEEIFHGEGCMFVASQVWVCYTGHVLTKLSKLCRGIDGKCCSQWVYGSKYTITNKLIFISRDKSVENRPTFIVLLMVSG